MIKKFFLCSFVVTIMVGIIFISSKIPYDSKYYPQNVSELPQGFVALQDLVEAPDSVLDYIFFEESFSIIDEDGELIAGGLVSDKDLIVSYGCGYYVNKRRFATIETAMPTANVIHGYKPKVGDVTVYNLSKDSFKEFLSDPSEKNVLMQCEMLQVYRMSAEEGYIQTQRYSDGEIISEEIKDGFYRICGWPVYGEFIEFMNEPENFNEILVEHGVNEEILTSAIITHVQFSVEDSEPLPPGTTDTMCIWLQTSEGNYFLEYNAYLYEDLNDQNFLFDFYDLEEYEDKYGYEV